MSIQNSAKSLFFVSLFALAAACGQAPGSSENPDENNSEHAPTPSADEAVALDQEQDTEQAIEQMIEDASQSVADLDEVTTHDEWEQAGLFLDSPATAAVKARGLAFSRSCTEDEEAGTAAVEIERGRKTAQFLAVRGSEAGAKAVQSFGAKEHIVRVWSREGGSVACQENGLQAEIDKRDLNGVHLNITFAHGIALGDGYKNAFNGSKGAMAAGFLAEGSRSLSFSQSTSEDGLLETAATIQSEVRRRIDAANLQQKSSKTLTFKTSDEAPLQVLSVRSADSKELVSRTIESGVMQSSGITSAQLVTTFTSVKYVPGGKCLRPQSGSIQSVLTKADGTVEEFSVVYSADSAVLTRPDGTTKEFTHSCAAAE